MDTRTPADRTATPVTVTEENFRQAESDMYFATTVNRAGGTGKWDHYREVISIDNQTVIRANRDTLYSGLIADLDAGPVTITLPEPNRRFMSLIVIDEEQYVVATVYAPGTFTFTRERVGTRYALLGVRTFINPNDPYDLEKVHQLQDAIRAEQPSGPGTFDVPNWDPVSQKKVREELIKQAVAYPDTKRMFGARGKVDPEQHLIGTATGWGANAPEDAIYLMIVPPNNDSRTIYQLQVKGTVPVDGFWSISVYGPDGYFVKNDLNTYSINNVTAKRDSDGSVTIQFGGCDGNVSNCIPTSPGWNYCVRLYRPRKEILDGAWKFPAAQPVS